MNATPTSHATPRAVTALLAGAIALVLTGGIAAAIPMSRESTPAYLERLPTARGPLVIPRGVEAPVQIDIPKVGISAPVDQLGLLDDGTLAVPQDFARTGWYGGLEAPGQVGTAVIVGHLDSFTGPAVFFRVPELVAGDEIAVTLADGTAVTFVVERVEQYPKEDFPTGDVYAPTDQRGLRLITCYGEFDELTNHYKDNVVVYATAQEAT